MVLDYGANIRRPSLKAGILWNTTLLNVSWLWSQHPQTVSGSWKTVRHNAFERFLILEPISAESRRELEYCVAQYIGAIPDSGANICKASLEAGILWNIIFWSDSSFWGQHFPTNPSPAIPHDISQRFLILGPFWSDLPTNPSPATGQNPQEPCRNRVGTV